MSNVLVRMVTETGLTEGNIAERMALSGTRSWLIVFLCGDGVERHKDWQLQ